MKNKIPFLGFSSKNLFGLMLLIFMCSTNYPAAQTTISAGNVFGTWKKSGSPYKITGQIIVPKDSLLKIESGVTVEFQGSYRMHVYGSLQAIGKISDTVTFTPANKTTGWLGIHFHKNSTNFKDSSLFKWCKLEYGLNFKEPFGPGLIRLDTITNIGFNKCLFQFNKAINGVGIYCSYSDFYIYSSMFYSNMATSNLSSTQNANGSAIGAAYCNLKISNCIFENNKSKLPLQVLDSVDGKSIGCLYIANCKIQLINNLFAGNSASRGTIALHIFDGTSFMNYENCIFKKNYIVNSYFIESQFSTEPMELNFKNCYAESNIIGNLNSNSGFISHSFPKSTVNISNFFVIYNSQTFLQTYAGQVSNSKLFGNTTGISCFKGNLKLFNTIISNNQLGAIANSGGKLMVVNSIIANNGSPTYKANTDVGGLQANSSSSASNYSVFNSIIQNNYNGKELYNLTGSRGGNVILNLKNSIIQGGKDSAKYLFGSGTISVTNYSNVQTDTVAFVKPPKGVGIAFADTSCDFHVIQTCSKTFAGLNAGLNTVTDGYSVLNLSTVTDLAGNPRIKCVTVDIGPYELDGAKNAVSVYSEPLDQKICPKTTASIAPETCGANLSYQWQNSSNGTSFSNISGATSATYTHSLKDSQYYRLIISQNECNKKDTSRIVKIGFKPGSTIAIAQQPKDTQACANSLFNLNAGIVGVNNTYAWQKSSNGTLFSSIPSATTLPYPQKIQDTSWYRLIISNSLCTNNKDTTRAAKINKLPLPKPTLGPDQTIANGSSATLTPGTFSSYNWYKGATTANYTVDKSNLDTGKNTVWVEVSNSYGCKAKDTVIINLRPVNGVKNALQAGIKLYPNPATEVLNIELSNNDVFIYELYAPNRKIIKYGVGNGNTLLNLKNIASGIYMLHITHNGNTYQSLFVKK